MKKIEIKINNYTFTAELLEDKAPKTCQAFLKALPMEDKIEHSSWSGDAMVIWYQNRPPNFLNVPPENVTIYGATRGLFYLVGEFYDGLYIVYRKAQFRCKFKDLRCNEFAKILDDEEVLRECGLKVRHEGLKNISIKKMK